MASNPENHSEAYYHDDVVRFLLMCSLGWAPRHVEREDLVDEGGAFGVENPRKDRLRQKGSDLRGLAVARILLYAKRFHPLGSSIHLLPTSPTAVNHPAGQRL